MIYQNKKIYKCLTSTNSVGIEFKKDIINIYFPLGYAIPNGENELEEKNAILDVLRTVALCKNSSSYNEYADQENEYYIPINSYLWLINDYLKNGLYNVSEKKYIQLQRGKINWKKTFNTKPLFNNSQIVYLNPVVEMKYNVDNIITEIHAICINRSIEQIGWLFGNISKVNTFNQTRGYDVYLDILNRELPKTYNDNKKMLLSHLINVIKELLSSENQNIVNNLLVDNYNYAWEKMVDYVFGNVIDKKNYFPKIKWELRVGKNPEPSMRPDTIIRKEEELYILDAKYYKFGVIENGSLPGSEDVDKQITYGEFNSKKFNLTNVYNAFILPFNVNDRLFISDKPIYNIGKVKSIGRLGSNLPYENIAIILFDTKYLINLYFNREKKDENLLLESITKEINNKKRNNTSQFSDNSKNHMI